MPNRPSIEIGMPLNEVDTPALLIDLDVFEKNLKRMAAEATKYSIRLRPHAKTHKCPIIGMQQIALGAVGVCCQKVSEAEAMVYGGVSNVLVTNEIIGMTKLRRVAALARQAQVAVCADDKENVEDISRAATEFNVEIPVYVEVNVGANRCGVEAGEPVLDLARSIMSSSNLQFAGLQAYQGKAQHIRDYRQRRSAIDAAAEKVNHTIDILQSANIMCPAVTGAGTGSYEFEARSKAFSELQVGSYIFMDADYALNLDQKGELVSDFGHSLFVYATVMSKPNPERAVLDAGLKALSVDSGMPTVVGYPGVTFVRAADEHGTLEIRHADCPIKIGDKIRLIPGHCDPTANLHDWYIGIRNERVEAIWPIAARGALF
jgi:D-serine deaminase-like pyridoxal phosphate-dependent protein